MLHAQHDTEITTPFSLGKTDCHNLCLHSTELWSPAGGSHTSPLIFSLHMYACKHVTIYIRTNMHTWTRAHTLQQQPSHLDKQGLLRHLFSSLFWQRKPKYHLPSKMPGIKRRRTSWRWGGEEKKRMEQERRGQEAGSTWRERTKINTPAIPLTSSQFRICWLRKIHNSKQDHGSLPTTPVVADRRDVYFPSAALHHQPWGESVHFSLTPLVRHARGQHILLRIHHLAALYVLSMCCKFFNEWGSWEEQWRPSITCIPPSHPQPGIQ